MTIFYAKVANYLGHGCSVTEYPDGSFCRDTVELKLDRYTLRLVQARDVITNKIKAGGLIYTTDIELSNVRTYPEGERVIIDLCNLLSLASFSQVIPFEFSFDGYTRSPSVRGESMYYRPLIDVHSDEMSKQYLQKVWPSYRNLKRSRRLPEVIDMLTIAELPVQPLEVKLAQIFIVMENLKGTYAIKNKIPFSKGYFRKRPVASAHKPVEKWATYKFEELLSLMFSDVGMKPSLRRIIKLRNEIIHFGLSRKPYTSLRKDYDYCHDIVREYLLRLLNYEGKYLLYSSAARSIVNISQAY